MGGPVTRSRLLAGSVLIATFIAGATVGGATMRLFAKDDVPQTARARDRRDDGERARRGSMFDDLGLSTAQRTRIDSIFEKRRRQTAEFWDEHGPQMSAIVDSTRAEIDRVLTDEQRARVAEWRARRRREHEQRERAEPRDSTRAPRPTSMDEWLYREPRHRAAPPGPVSLNDERVATDDA